MKEELPFIELTLAGEPFVATPLNTELFTFVGKTILQTGEIIENSSRNHVFLQREESRINEDGHEVTNGTYIFAPETVNILGAAMLRHDFPARINQRSIPQSDEDAYQTYIAQQISQDEIGDFMPDGWDSNES